MRTGFGVKGLILNGNSALALCKPEGGWDLPGGRIESGETPEQTLLRELDEEIGSIKVKILGFIIPWSFFKSPDLIIHGTTYPCLYLGGKILLSPEHSGFLWIPLNQLRDMDIYWKFGLDRLGVDSMEHSSERMKAYGDLESRRIAAGNGGRI